MPRPQIPFEPEQYEEISRVAQRDGKTAAHFVREIVDFELERRKRLETKRAAALLGALQDAARLRDQILSDNGGQVFKDDHIEVMREERDAEIAGAIGLDRR